MRPSKLTRSKLKNLRAQTLIELTLVISVLLGLIAVLFIGVRAYRRGTDRAVCIQNIASAQKAVRSLGNLRDLGPGDTVAGLRSELIGPGKFVPQEPDCPGGGTYSDNGDVLPDPGIPYLSCTLPEHLPQTTQNW